MAIHLHVSNALSALAQQLAKDLKAHQKSVFAPEQIVTQTEGMNNWLKNQLASHLGIAANLSFGKPSDVISKIYYLLCAHKKSILSVDYIKWNLFHFLSESGFQEKFPGIARYYASNEVKQIALAAKVADLFDQYQIYRPDVIETWTQTELVNVADDFQAYLWVRLQEVAQQQLLDKTNIIQEIIQAIQQPEQQAKLKANFPNLQFFGIAVITPYYLKLFNALAEHIDIRFYLLNPAPTMYWLDDQSEKEIARFAQKYPRIKREHMSRGIQGNELLNSWGNIIRDSFLLMFQDEMFINSYNDALAVEPETPKTLLQKIQHDVFYNADTESRQVITQQDLKDGSVQINACFTTVREVEVLYNYLVELVTQSDKPYSPRDIVVMASDIDAYAPYIRAVFDNAPYQFPYTIADEHINAGHSMFNAIEQILSMQLDLIKTEDILLLFESKYVRERFGIQDLDLIRRALEEANIRFGQKGNRAQGTHVMSWEYGLKRLMYGICISGSPVAEIDGETLIPVDVFEGSDAYDLVKFWSFMQTLETTLQKRNSAKTVLEWGKYVQELVEDLVFQSSEQEDEDYHRLIHYIERLSAFEEISAAPVSFEVFRHSFLQVLNTETKAKSFAGAGITFCSLIPMRSIPFKVVAMMGMNFDQFPRKENEPSFNLIEQKKRKGDRNVKDNDKHLFLETILSAEENFYISYIGRSAKDAVSIPPSSLLDELMAYIVQGVDKADVDLYAQLVTVHPLHGFSQQYFNGSGLKNYLGDWVSKAPFESKAENPAENIYLFEEIALADLLNFMGDPIKFYFNKCLGIYYREEELLLPDTEVFELDKLDLWQLKQDLMAMTEADQANYYERLVLQGVLPLKHVGQLAFEQVQEELQSKKSFLEELVQGEVPRRINIDFYLGAQRIQGACQRMYGDDYVYWSDSKNNKKHFVLAFLEYVVLKAAGHDFNFRFADLEKKESHVIVAADMSKLEAETYLQNIVTHFMASYQTPFLFSAALPGNPYEWFKKSPQEFLSKVRGFERNEKVFFFNGNPYNSKALEHGFFDDEHAAVFQMNVELVFDEMAKYLPQIKKLWK